ncbi:MAG: hypothetical protein KC931_01415 [Candidatus Omnitrophica bacterium]|nr:hypothetical protein [Candidatus Omnitrophota bacterium]MCA9434310.1 hypothetical protein [Candidatus Omnitrophota bacterium]MCA9445743.1 hypothetical protein [Candidatus Omnitrophota bacterium]
MKTSIFLPLLLAFSLSGIPSILVAQEYEPIPVFAPSQFVSEEFIQGSSYKVIGNATADGMLASFSVWSRYGWYRPQSVDYLKIRIAEIRAMDALVQLQQEPLFLQGVSDQVSGTLEQTGRALTRPLQTLKEVPLGLQKFGSQIKARSEEGRSGSGAGIHDKAKRQLAQSLGVDPYTDNARLQEMLTTVATNKNRGQLTARIGSLFVPGGVGIAVSAAQINKSLQETLVNLSPAELHQVNRDALSRLGCPQQDVSMFLAHPVHTPTTQTAIRVAMEGLSSVEGIGQYLSSILDVPNVEVAHIYQRRIQMAEYFHRNIRPLKKLVVAQSTPIFLDSEGKVVIFLNLDYLYWNEMMDQGIERLLAAVGTREGDVIITGATSPLAEAKLNQYGLKLYQQTQ